jgi:excisionase family DNA binding protein
MSTWLTVASVADDLGVSPRTVLRWVERGELEALRLPGGRLRISHVAYSSWLAARTVPASQRTLAIVGDEEEP